MVANASSSLPRPRLGTVAVLDRGPVLDGGTAAGRVLGRAGPGRGSGGTSTA